MPATVFVVATFRARDGREDALKQVLTGLIAPTRREIGCYQYDLLQSTSDPRAFCFVERWENHKSLDQHLESDHVKKTVSQVTDLVDGSPEVTRYTLV